MSFSTGSSGFTLADVMLNVGAYYFVAGDSVTLSLVSDSSTSPGTLLDVLGTIQASSLTPVQTDIIYDIPLGSPIALAANTRYWLEMSTESSNNQIYWLAEGDNSGTGVAGEYWYYYSTLYANNDYVENESGPVQARLSNTVPEPSSMAVLTMALFGLVCVRRVAVRSGGDAA
jgi:hypothetical protein